MLKAVAAVAAFVQVVVGDDAVLNLANCTLSSDASSTAITSTCPLLSYPKVKWAIDRFKTDAEVPANLDAKKGSFYAIHDQRCAMMGPTNNYQMLVPRPGCGTGYVAYKLSVINMKSITISASAANGADSLERLNKIMISLDQARTWMSEGSCRFTTGGCTSTENYTPGSPYSGTIMINAQIQVPSGGAHDPGHGIYIGWKDLEIAPQAEMWSFVDTGAILPGCGDYGGQVTCDANGFPIVVVS